MSKNIHKTQIGQNLENLKAQFLIYVIPIKRLSNEESHLIRTSMIFSNTTAGFFSQILQPSSRRRRRLKGLWLTFIICEDNGGSKLI